MKTTIKQADLKQGLTYLKQLKDYTTYNLLIDTKDKEISLNYEFNSAYINYVCQSDNKENDTIYTNLKVLEEIASNTDSLNLDLNYKNDNSYLNIQEKNNSSISDYYLIATKNNDIKPLEIVKNKDIQIKANEFIKALKSINKAVAKKDSLPIIQCYNFVIKDNKLTLTTIDGFRLMQAFINCKSNKDYEFNLHYKGIDTLIRTFTKLINKTPKKDKDLLTIDISVNNDNVTFFKDNLSVVIRIVDGDFLRIDDIFPTHTETDITLNKNELLNAIKKCLKFTDKNNNSLIKFIIEKNKFYLESKTGFGNIQTELTEIKINGNDLTIGFNGEYIKDALEALDKQEIKLELTSPVSPVDIKTDNKRVLILPVRLKQDN